MTKRKVRPAIDRFQEKYVVKQESGCWIWTACTTSNGYGCFYLNGKRMLAHRASLALFREACPDEKVVLHACDTPACVNPDHLRIGTHADNVADMISKGRNAQGDRHGMRTQKERRPCGERNGNARLTEKQVTAIRACSLPNRKVAEILGMHPSQIGRIKRGLSW